MSRPHVVGAAELSSLRDLELVARTTVEGLRQGLHRSPFHGYSAEFSQYRHYRPGDDLKYVDWKAFARTDRLYSRQFRETTNLGAWFVVDASASMAFPEARSKFALARTAAAVLATLVIDQGDAAGVLALADDAPGGVRYVAARSGRYHLRLVLASLAQLGAGGAATIAAALRRVGALLRRRGMVVVISDFYDEEPALAEVRRLSRMGHEVIVVHVVAAEEMTLPSGGSLEFEDLETGKTLITNVAAIHRDYSEVFQKFLARMERSVVREGLEYLRLTTDAPLEPALRRFLVHRRSGT